MRYAKALRQGAVWPIPPPGGGFIEVSTVPVACCVDCRYSFGPIDAGYWTRPGGWTQADDGTWYLTARARRRKPRPGGELIELPLNIL